MKKLVGLCLGFVLALSLLSGCGSKADTIVVGAKDFTEQDVLGNLLTIFVSENTELKVDYKNEMSSNVVFSAITNGDIDLYVDYSGTVYGNYLGYSEMKSADEIYDIAVKEMEEQYDLLMLDPLGFNNTYTLSVRKDTAEKYNLKTYSDLAKISQDLKFGGTFEVLNRNDGIPNLKKAYDMSFQEETAIDGTLRYTAIANDEIQIIDAFSTDGLLLEYDLVVLEDDKSFFPPYDAATVIRKEITEKHPELLDLLSQLAGKLDDEAMRNLNYKVDVKKENPQDVAKAFLEENSLIPT